MHAQAGSLKKALKALDAAITRSPSAALLVRRAKLQRELAAEPPFKASHSKAMRWMSGPAGQQHAAVSLERAMRDYRAALALDDRKSWRLLEDGRVLTTVNTGAANTLASPPEILLQALAQGSKAATKTVVFKMAVQIASVPEYSHD